MKILSFIGARPQFIKEAVIHAELKKRGLAEIIVNSGQHYDFNMSDIFFQTLDIKPPDYSLGVGSGRHGEMTGKIMIEFEKVVLDLTPDLIIVYGDTNTTLAGSLVAAKLKIQLAHIEAGIRMLPKDMPEEINRVLVDHISNLLFCPSSHSADNLKKEGLLDNVHLSGDVMYDLYLKMEKEFRFDIYNKLGLKNNKYAILTLHRDYNVDDPHKLSAILDELNEISNQIQIVFPVHPRTKKCMERFGLEPHTRNMTLIQPCDYLNLMGLVKNSKRVITDSGGLQKEAFFACKACAVIMPHTGWTELIDHGYSVLCNEKNLARKFSQLDDISQDRLEVYGKGNAGSKIVDILEDTSRF